MNESEKFSVKVERNYPYVSAENLFRQIENGNFFTLTGADEISFDFSEGGAFRFVFNERGIIEGKFLQIIPDEKIILQWNVSGFGKPDEVDTRVCISVQHEKIIIEHTEIKNKEACDAKEKAWKEILHDLSFLNPDS